ncbi:MAG: hypothetical protein ABR881_10010 [Candidatus Sulfotelmatobacter sp.]
MLRLPKIRLLFLLPVLLGALMPPWLSAQDDPNDIPLGDVARTLRNKTLPSQDVIDDDNLTKVMKEGENHHGSGSALRFRMAGEGKGFQVAAPDVTCSLSFSANAKSLLSSAYAQMDLPPGEVVKLEGPATIEGDALIVSVNNQTDWHVSEVAVALTIVKKTHEASLATGTTFNDGATLLPANPPQESEVRPEKKPDLTMIYRMRAAAPPWATTVFSAPLNLDLEPDEEWHWAIVQARGYPPQSYHGSPAQTTAQTNGPASAPSVPGQALSIRPISIQPSVSQPSLVPTSATPQNAPAVPAPENSQ